ncbi:hypothetical protein BDY17DRAFT_115664 [Neohortaea acidophila]|uniref:AhpC/TSA antioxidant enzyme-domain-containing protein n=1 Tax=Neohortaea acidophila TaxID=245834 RepID=A0A6A6PV21_9PEZI|nr:uncharacterized protein BDY17DRAFT_115664 [Neohortaea acidophila]KAF2483805.1 hypothetical protein BDY17DRAFT_115664 [Neohortaea acidophila]
MSVHSSKHGKSKVPEEHYELPSAQTLQEAGELEVADEYGRKVQFKKLYDSKGGQQLIVFIRHFFCGNCEDYIRTLSKELPPSVLHTSSPPTHLTIIGCGEISPIPNYRTRTMSDILGTDTHFTIYCDPSRKLYAKLGMLSNMSTAPDGKKPGYLTKSKLENVTSSLKNAVMSGADAIKGGHPAQNGGEMLFANGELVWFKRMRHTEDHAEVEELKQVLGLV